MLIKKLINETLISTLFFPHRQELAIPMYTDGRSKCSMYAVNFTELMEQFDMLMVNTSWPTQPCIHGWEYDRLEVPYSTIATEV